MMDGVLLLVDYMGAACCYFDSNEPVHHAGRYLPPLMVPPMLITLVTGGGALKLAW